MHSPDDYTAWFETLGSEDIDRVGGKNASLGEMIGQLKEQSIKVPDGFAVTTSAYRDFLAANQLDDAIQDRLEAMQQNKTSLHETGEAIRSLFLHGEFPAASANAITTAYRELSRRAGLENISVAVRSSATAEDLPDASFAGQQETFLNVRGEEALLDRCRACYASLFTDRAISYREARGFDHLKVALSIGVQRMVRSDKAGSGVMFSIDTDSGFPGVVVITAAWGLGENVVQGTVNPDKYLVSKGPLDEARFRPIIERQLGEKEITMVYADGEGQTVNRETEPQKREAFVLNDDEVLQLARWAVAIERHYGRPMDMEWAKDGETDELTIVQARPETVHSARIDAPIKSYHLEEQGEPLLSGAAVGQSITTGDLCLIDSAEDIDQFRPGCILVARTTDPDWVPIMKAAKGIITDHGGTTSHAAIVSRELGVPAVVGTRTATQVLKEGQTVTLSCAEGDTGYVYPGALKFSTQEINLRDLPETRTAMMVNVASPAAAFQWWRLPARGVGLARMEFIINHLIKVHPMALVHPEAVTDEKTQEKIRDLTRHYSDPRDYFIDQLAQGIAKIAAPYYPNPVIVRLSDFKTSEYAHLIGGGYFEPDEANPMLGFRGASRYYHSAYREGFALECRVLRTVREVIGFDNVIVMVPFCRTPKEADRVLEVMAENGLERGRNGLKVYAMCEVPSNIILAEKFAQRFDGFSIGSNDLTQLTLGVDRDSTEMASLFDERDEAVTTSIADLIKRAHACGIPVGLCGQAPSNYPAFAEFLVEAGIDSISLNPDSFVETIRHVAKAESAQKPLQWEKPNALNQAR